jgi:hypothetical protein
VITRILAIILFYFSFFATSAQYYPDSVWQSKSPGELKMNKQLIDSAINFALQNDSKTDYDLRIACLKAYANEPNFHILGPTRERGKPSGLIIKNGYIVAQWGDINRCRHDLQRHKKFSLHHRRSRL